MADETSSMVLGERLSSYPKVWNLGHPSIDGILLDPVLVQEKVDGSQFSFGKIGGRLLMRSSGAVVYAESAPDMFRPAVDTVLAVESRLPEGVIFRAEAFKGAHHNHLTYGRAPVGGMVLFDVMVGPERYSSYEDVARWAKQLGVEWIRSFGVRRITSIADLDALLSNESALGGCTVEGVVLKNYSVFGRDGKPMFAKVVRADFREEQKVSWKQTNFGPDALLQMIGEGLRTEARWRKAVQHLAEAGEAQHAPQDIGKLIVLVPQDVRAECEEEIKARLFAWAWPKLQRMVTAGLPEWYKRELAKTAFEEKV